MASQIRYHNKRKFEMVDECDDVAICHSQSFHSDLVVKQYKALSHSMRPDAAPILIDGEHLEISDVISIARYGSKTRIDFGAQQTLFKSCKALERNLAGGEIIYGVNTGFGGTADLRTKETEKLQQMLIRELNYGILPEIDNKSCTANDETSNGNSDRQFDLSEELFHEQHHLPRTWTRATMLIRINSLVKGYSGVRPVVVERLQNCLERDITPLIPLRGSISASGDLSPLSYIGGTIQGKSSIRVFSKTNVHFTAKQAFTESNLEPILLQAKEGLAVVNGTAASCASAALALHDTNGLAVLSQILTAMSVEALKGTPESFHHIFGKTRPHTGQIESAGNILRFLSGSKLTELNTGTKASLRQDRYSIRTVPQWIGPVLEDLVQAHKQIHIECNSVTDNPLFSFEGEFLHGGNFQAKSVTSAMEKTRQGIESIGRMLFVQCTEIINPATNRGLPPNLVADDPSTSCIFKGADINIAALLSELGFLSSPVNHVQTAEMGNQSLNSLALISARYTNTAVDILSQIIAQHLIVVCQALDLRAMNTIFFDAYRPIFRDQVFKKYAHLTSSSDAKLDDLQNQLWDKLIEQFDATVNMDAKDRFHTIAKSLRHVAFEYEGLMIVEDFFRTTTELVNMVAESLQDRWKMHRESYLRSGDASEFLGMAGKKIYCYIRKELKVPMLHGKLLDASDLNIEGEKCSKSAMTVGSYTSVVYCAIKSGTLAKVAMDILGDK